MDAVAKKQLADKKKAYMNVRKEKLKTLAANQKKELSTIKQRIAALPRNQRTAEGKRMRAAIRDKYSKLKKRLPTAAKKTMGEVVSLIKGIKTLRI